VVEVIDAGRVIVATGEENAGKRRQSLGLRIEGQ